LRENIRSFYWWEGAVQNDAEFRLSFSTERTLDEVVRALGEVHNYDVPMIIADVETSSSAYWKGVIVAAEGTKPDVLAEELAASRLVACAQVAPNGEIAVKTTAKARPGVERLANAVRWVAIDGNAPYMKWLDEETSAATDKTCG
jgi:uncharacterized protein involved in tolerance to divalent cations